MYYLIRHVTRYDYTRPIRENVMVLHLHPRSDGSQRSLAFDLTVSPSARIFEYRDYVGNVVHHFDVPASHDYLVIVSESLVETLRTREVPDRLSSDSWGSLDEIVETEDVWEMLLPSRFAMPSEKLSETMKALGISRDCHDPLTAARLVTRTIFETFEYVPDATRVDSKIDETLETKRGVCQDFAHIMIAMLRDLRIPARYVSGYLYHREVGEVYLVDDATHAWVEALMPGLGWIGFDPTTNVICDQRHIRTAVGRDYADVAPTSGVFRGDATSLLSVCVKVWPWGSGLSVAESDDLSPEKIAEIRPRLAAALEVEREQARQEQQ